MKPFLFLLYIAVLSSFSQLPAGNQAELERFIHVLAHEDTMTVDRKCGTRYPLMIHTHWDEISAADQQLYRTEVLIQPVRQRSMETAGGHFRLHWNESLTHVVPLEDLDQNNIPDYIDSAAVIFENVWDVEINQLGFPPPPLNDGETDSLYDVYFTDMIYYGITWFPDPEIPSIPGENYASYMEVENDFVGFPTPGLEGLKVTAAHEFHHAIQLGYNVRSEDFFFYEMTSTWMEDLVYPDVNDYYQYLPSLFNSVSNSGFNTYNGQYEYGNNIYLLMLQKRFGAGIVREIWEQIRDINGLEALAAVLKSASYHSSWLESLSEYGEWLYFTGQRATPDLYFNEAAAYPEIRIFSSDRYSFSNPLNTPVEMARFANRFLIIRDSFNEDLYITLSGSGGNDGAFRLLEEGAPGLFTQLNNQALFSRTSLDSFAVIVTNTSSATQSYSLRISSGSTSDIVFGPNPLLLNKGQYQVTFQNIPVDADVFIYTVSGKRISRLSSTGNTLRVWDLKDDRGDRVASGVYLVLIKGKNVEKIEKLAILQ